MRANTRVQGKGKKGRRRPKEKSSSSPLRRGYVKDMSAVPDILFNRIVGQVTPSNFFTTAVQYNGFAFSANSIGTFAPALTTVFPYTAAEAVRYTRYRVIRSKVELTMVCRESTAQVEAFVVATTGSGTSGNVI
jgi:hypothetical protein